MSKCRQMNKIYCEIIKRRGKYGNKKEEEDSFPLLRTFVSYPIHFKVKENEPEQRLMVD